MGMGNAFTRRDAGGTVMTCLLVSKFHLPRLSVI